MINEVEQAIKSVKSFSQAENILNIDRKKIKQVCIENNIDYSHFTYFKPKKSFDEYIGQTIYYLTINSISTECRSGRIKRYALCSCSCGNEHRVRLDIVIGGRCKSCGCFSKRRSTMDGRNNPAFNGCEEIPSTWFNNFKYKAKKRKIHFDLSIEDAYVQFLKQDKKCALTGQELYFGRCRWYSETNASIDRIDSLKGYEKDNIQFVTKNINIMKSTMTQEEFINNCKLVTEWALANKIPA